MSSLDQPNLHPSEMPYQVFAVAVGDDGGVSIQYVDTDEVGGAVVLSKQISVPPKLTEDIAARIEDLIFAACDIVQYAEEYLDNAPRRISPPR